jgi:hypothetical protein
MVHGDVAAQVTAVGGWVCFEDEAGAWLNGPVRRTWGKAGQTPVLRLSGKRNDKISMVAWICFKEGEEPRMIYAIKPSGGYTKKDFPRFLNETLGSYLHRLAVANNRSTLSRGRSAGPLRPLRRFPCLGTAKRQPPVDRSPVDPSRHHHVRESQIV